MRFDMEVAPTRALVVWQPVDVQSAVGTSGDAPDLGRLKNLDPDAWEQLYRHAHPVLWRFARARMATSEQAEDSVSETMVRAMSAIERYRHGESGLQAWLVGIERNVIRESHRTGRRTRSIRGHLDAGVADASDRVPDAVIADEEARAVRTAFERLDPDDQDVLAMRVVARLDSETTASVMGKRPGAVRMAQARALNRLRTMLREEDR